MNVQTNLDGRIRPELLSLKDAATQLGVHVQTLRRAIQAKELTAKTGYWKGYRVSQADLDAYTSRKIVEVKAE